MGDTAYFDTSADGFNQLQVTTQWTAFKRGFSKQQTMHVQLKTSFLKDIYNFISMLYWRINFSMLPDGERSRNLILSMLLDGG